MKPTLRIEVPVQLPPDKVLAIYEISEYEALPAVGNFVRTFLSDIRPRILEVTIGTGSYENEVLCKCSILPLAPDIDLELMMRECSEMGWLFEEATGVFVPLVEKLWQEKHGSPA